MKIKSFVLEWRKSLVLFCGLLGMVLSWGFLFAINLWDCFGDFFKNEKIESGIFFIVLALPGSFYLWYLRDYDKRDGIQQQREGNWSNSFSSAMKLFTEESKPSRVVGLRMLSKMRRKGLFEENIKEIFKHLFEIDLSVTELFKIDLRNACFRNANLEDTLFNSADLRDTFWTGKELNLKGTDFTGADLRGANLRRTNLSLSELGIAKYDEDTKFPGGFSEEVKNTMVFVPKEKEYKK